MSLIHCLFLPLSSSPLLSFRTADPEMRGLWFSLWRGMLDRQISAPKRLESGLLEVQRSSQRSPNFRCRLPFGFWVVSSLEHMRHTMDALGGVPEEVLEHLIQRELPDLASRPGGMPELMDRFLEDYLHIHPLEPKLDVRTELDATALFLRLAEGFVPFSCSLLLSFPPQGDMHPPP